MDLPRQTLQHLFQQVVVLVAAGREQTLVAPELLAKDLQEVVQPILHTKVVVVGLVQ